HLLRAQATSPERRPLVVMTPKSLLRHPEAVSRLADLSTGRFAPVIGDAGLSPEQAGKVERVIVCSGKVYFDLLERRRKTGASTVAIVRLEQLYPFPAAALEAEFARHPDARTVVWCQE